MVGVTDWWLVDWCYTNEPATEIKNRERILHLTDHRIEVKDKQERKRRRGRFNGHKRKNLMQSEQTGNENPEGK